MVASLDTLLLLALPAAGKSELRRYLDGCGPDELRDLHLRPGIQLDDYPYVHLIRRISAELRNLGEAPVFFESSDRGWLEGRDWGTLIHLLNQDYDSLTRHETIEVAPAADRLLDRLDAARRAVGAPAPFSNLDPAVRAALCAAIEDEAAIAAPSAVVDRAAHTVIIEFARGGPEGTPMPLQPPHGYAYSLGELSESILRSAVILYVWVDPAESRRRNRERAVPGPAGDASILNHGVPESVMVDEYGTDDMDWMLAHSNRPGTVTVRARRRLFHVPAARFDNRADRTSFLRADRSDWDGDRVASLHADLREVFARLAGRLAARDG